MAIITVVAGQDVVHLARDLVQHPTRGRVEMVERLVGVRRDEHVLGDARSLKGSPSENEVSWATRRVLT